MRAGVLKSFGIVDKCRRKIAHKKEKQSSVYIQRGVEEKFRFGAAAEGIESEIFLNFILRHWCLRATFCKLKRFLLLLGLPILILCCPGAALLPMLIFFWSTSLS
jgi:hypothetical protein